MDTSALNLSYFSGRTVGFVVYSGSASTGYHTCYYCRGREAYRLDGTVGCCRLAGASPGRRESLHSGKVGSTQ
jgi:hypothetical protein